MCVGLSVQAPFPTVCATTPPRARKSHEVADLAEMLRKLRVTLNVRVDNGKDAKEAPTTVVSDGVSPGGESKFHGGEGGESKSGATTTVAAHIDVCVS